MGQPSGIPGAWRATHVVLLWAVFAPICSLPSPFCLHPRPQCHLAFIWIHLGFRPVESSGRSLEGRRKRPEQFSPSTVTPPSLPVVVPPPQSSQPDNPTGVPASIRRLWALVTPPPPFVLPAWSSGGFPLLLISDGFTGSCLAPQHLHLLHNHPDVLTSLCSLFSVSSASPHRYSSSSLLVPIWKVGSVLSDIPTWQKPEIRIVMGNVLRFQTPWMPMVL